ncbi:MAG: hypothetical protein RIS47_2302 [Bacteroidota bacterium]|jgi:hypothetical protein
MMQIEKLPRFIGCEEYEEYFFQCEATDQAGHYVFKGETPNGGKSLLFIFMKDGQKVSIEEAKFVEIQELSPSGALVHIEHGKADVYSNWTNPNL